MEEMLPVTLPVRASDVAGRRERSFELAPDAETRAAIAASLEIETLDSLLFRGVLRPLGRTDVLLEGRLQARAVQACVVTLAPVVTNVDQAITRRYIDGLEMPEGDEIEMPEDDTTEPLPEVIDLGAVALEALALALPDYPRAEGAGLGEVVFAPPGVAPLTGDALKPFAGLAALKGLIEDKDKP